MDLPLRVTGENYVKTTFIVSGNGPTSYRKENLLKLQGQQKAVVFEPQPAPSHSTSSSARWKPQSRLGVAKTQGSLFPQHPGKGLSFTGQRGRTLVFLMLDQLPVAEAKF